MRTNAFHLAWFLPGSSMRARGVPWTGLSVDLEGTPERVAAPMGEVIEHIDGDGLMSSMPNVGRRTMAAITDGLVPALQQRSPTRSADAHHHLRDSPLEF